MTDYAGPEQWDRLPREAVTLLRDQALEDVRVQEERYSATPKHGPARTAGLKRLNDAKQYHRDLNVYVKKRKQATVGRGAQPTRDVLAAAFIARFSPAELLSMSAGRVAEIAVEAYRAADIVANCSEDFDA
jgi:hypothetical protein